MGHMRRSGGGGSTFALAARAIPVVLSAASGKAPAGFTTASVTTVTVAAGGTATAAQAVHLDALPTKADIVLAFDTTGSMIDLLTAAKNDAGSIVSSLQTEFPTADALRFAVVDFRD